MRIEDVSTEAGRSFGEDRIAQEADLLLDEYTDYSVAYLAKGLVDRAQAYDDRPAAALVIAAELRRRQAAGVRFWPARERQPDMDCVTSVANHSA